MSVTPTSNGASTRASGRKKMAKGKRGVRIGDLMRTLRRHRHRGAVFAHLAEYVLGAFTDAYGDDEPQFALTSDDGAFERADIEVVDAIAHELEQRAHEERHAVAQLLGADIEDVIIDVMPIHDEEEERDLVGELIAVGIDQLKKKRNGKE